MQAALSPVTTSTGSYVARCRGSCVPAVSVRTRMVILDRVEQPRYVLLSGLIHLDHGPLNRHMVTGDSSAHPTVMSTECETRVYCSESQRLSGRFLRYRYVICVTCVLKRPEVRDQPKPYRSPVRLFPPHGSVSRVPHTDLTALQVWGRPVALSSLVLVQVRTVSPWTSSTSVPSFSAAISVPSTPSSSSPPSSAAISITHIAVVKKLQVRRLVRFLLPPLLTRLSKILTKRSVGSVCGPELHVRGYWQSGH